MFVFISWLISNEARIHIQYFFGLVRNKFQDTKHLPELIKKRSKVQEKWCFKFWPMKNIFPKVLVDESLIMACLQIYRELLSFATFLQEAF